MTGRRMTSRNSQSFALTEQTLGPLPSAIIDEDAEGPTVTTAPEA